jgi:hypothetical protein
MNSSRPGRNLHRSPITKDAIKRADLNADGREDYVLDVGAVVCDGTGSAAKLWLSVMGADCGKKPAASFAEENFCERPLQWSAGTRKFEFAPVSTVRKIE